MPELVEAIEAAGHAPAAVCAPGGTGPQARPLAGRHVLVTSGPTHEPIDPVRYIANRSSGKQGAAIAAEAAALGARVTLVSGPTSVAPPAGVDVVNVETARGDAGGRARGACRPTSPSSPPPWPTGASPRAPTEKIKKGGKGAPGLELVENPDILKTIAH